MKGVKKMTHQQIRAAILEGGYKAAIKAGTIAGGVFNIHEVSKDWGEEKEKIDFNVDYLRLKGWIELLTLVRGCMTITAAGVDEYEKTHAQTSIK